MKYAVSYLVSGAVGVAGILGFLASQHNQDVCTSGVGSFAQALSPAIASKCGEIDFFHTASIVLIVLGVIGALVTWTYQKNR